MSPQAQQNRNISGMFDLNAMEICVKVGIKKGTNGYKDSNQLMVALTPDNKDFLPQGSIPMQNTQFLHRHLHHKLLHNLAVQYLLGRKSKSSGRAIPRLLEHGQGGRGPLTPNYSSK